MCVVSYRNSTSNHNVRRCVIKIDKLYLIEILHQTTTGSRSRHFEDELYLIEILHQTTTTRLPRHTARWLYLIEILHQTTTPRRRVLLSCCCILSKFYIKPQPFARVRELLKGCILSKFYIKPQLSLRLTVMLPRCILSKFYIKPQRI